MTARAQSFGLVSGLTAAVVCLGAVAYGCSSDGGDSLLGSSGAFGSAARDGGVATDEAGNPILPGDAGAALALAQKLFADALPDFKTTCGTPACHGAPNTASPAWLAPPEYDSLKNYDSNQTGDKKFIVSDSLTSRLFTKGPHTGPAMPQPDGTGTLGDKVKHWLDVEAAALKATTLPATAPMAVQAGPNTFDLGPAGSGINGAQLTFTASIAGSLLSLSSVKLVAPASTGVHIVHPIFVQVPADTKLQPLLDPADQGSNIDDAAAATKSIAVGPGSFILTGFKWSSTDKLMVQFAKAESTSIVTIDAGQVGCKNVSGFQKIAGLFQGQIVQPNCTAACHKTGGGGDGALDLNALVTNPPDYTAACNQALTQVTLNNKAQSPLILHPTGQMGNHTGGVVSDVNTFTQTVLSWLAGE